MNKFMNAQIMFGVAAALGTETFRHIHQDTYCREVSKELGSGPRMVVERRVSNGKRKQAAARAKRGDR